MGIANNVLGYGRAADPLAHAPKLVQADFIDRVEGWTENVRAFWVRARDSQ